MWSFESIKHPLSHLLLWISDLINLKWDLIACGFKRSPGNSHAFPHLRTAAVNHTASPAWTLLFLWWLRKASRHFLQDSPSFEFLLWLISWTHVELLNEIYFTRNMHMWYVFQIFHIWGCLISLHKKKSNLGKCGHWGTNFYSNWIAISPHSLLAFIFAEGKSDADFSFSFLIWIVCLFLKLAGFSILSSYHLFMFFAFDFSYKFWKHLLSKLWINVTH